MGRTMHQAFSSQEDTIEAWRRRIGRLDPRQIAAWRAGTPDLLERVKSSTTAWHLPGPDTDRTAHP